MSIGDREFSDDNDPIPLDARANGDTPIGENGANELPPAGAVANGNGAAHVDGEFTAGAEDPASEPSAPATQLCPNRADINKHLYALFHPDFVRAYPDAWIEIAYANPATGGGLRTAEQFSAFDLEAAGDFAERKNRKGFNIYVGVALRQGETPSTSNGRASGENVLTACRAWTDFDGEGDAERVEAILKDEEHPGGGSGHDRDDPVPQVSGSFRASRQAFRGWARSWQSNAGRTNRGQHGAARLAWRRRRPERRSGDAAGWHRVLSVASQGRARLRTGTDDVAGDRPFARLFRRRADRAGHRGCRSIPRVWQGQRRSIRPQPQLQEQWQVRKPPRPARGRAPTPSWKHC